MRDISHQHGRVRPLAGASVIVTRPASSAAALRRKIIALGGTPIGLPGIGVRSAADPDAARRGLLASRASDFVVFTSPNAARYTFALMPQLHFARATRVCAVGPGSARALARHGVREVVYPAQRQDSEGLLALAPLARMRGRRVSLIGAPDGRDLLREELQRRGAKVELVHVYRRTAPRLNRRHFDALERAAAPLLTLLSSAEAIAHLRVVLPAALFARLIASAAIVSSARLAHAAQAAGWREMHIAGSASGADLCAAAVTALAQHRL
ncbi:MAG: uroporphyrinogen-III synthase [Gammaproteobacteria bacterium]|nr:MAG: uroporphyrinogen-III synthase [Gammaproteobacteria bacterium]